MRYLSTRTITTLALMLSMIFVLSAIEQMLPPLPFQMRFGLSNIVTMYALFFLGKRPAFLLAVLKSLFVLLTRGPVASLLSLGGGVFSLLVIVTLFHMLPRASYLALSVCGALAHNLAQIAIASSLTATNLVPIYLPILIVTGVASGALTGTLLRVVLPVFADGAGERVSVRA